MDLLLKLSETLWHFLPTIVFLMITLLLVVDHGMAILLNHLPWWPNDLSCLCISLHDTLLLVKLDNSCESALGQIALQLTHVLRVTKVMLMHVIIRNAFHDLYIILQCVQLLCLHPVVNRLLHRERFAIFVVNFELVVLRFLHTLNLRKSFQGRAYVVVR